MAAGDLSQSCDKTVLVVEDEEHLRRLIKNIIKVPRMNFVFASDGQEALDLFAIHHEQIDCVILDVIIPRVSGLEVFRKFIEIKPQIRVLFMTGYPIPDRQLYEFLEQNHIGLIRKPFSIDEFRQQLSAVLG